MRDDFMLPVEKLYNCVMVAVRASHKCLYLIGNDSVAQFVR